MQATRSIPPLGCNDIKIRYLLSVLRVFMIGDWTASVENSLCVLSGSGRCRSYDRNHHILEIGSNCTVRGTSHVGLRDLPDALTREIKNMYNRAGMAKNSRAPSLDLSAYDPEL